VNPWRSKKPPLELFPWISRIGDIALKLCALQSIAVHQTSAELAVSMSIRTSLRAGEGAEPAPPRAGNFTFSIGISNEFSFHWLLSPVRKPIA
jgi:hypothetical protein